MSRREFEFEILAPWKADVFLACPEDRIPWAVVERLDRAGICVAGRRGDATPDDELDRGLARGCAGVVRVAPDGAGGPGTGARATLDCGFDEPADVEAFLAAVSSGSGQVRPYAFFVGRLERDFRHAREAIRTAIEAEAGIPCLWADDGRHRTNVESVRERTRLLIKHAAMVVADLTLGVESPERENPSRAHEIGMAIAYERPLMLCSQEPRRYPYFSIGDMQMTFWATEDELERDVRTWIRFNGRSIARRVFNYRLPAPMYAEPVFRYDPALRYVGPKTPMPSGMRRLLVNAGLRLP
jgi:hypothetical protein